MNQNLLSWEKLENLNWANILSFLELNLMMAGFGIGFVLAMKLIVSICGWRMMNEGKASTRIY